MTTNKRNALIAFALLFLIALASILTMDVGTLRINGEEMSALGGFSGFLIACLIGFLALFFAVTLTGIALVLAAVLMVIVIAALLGSIVLALLPLILPVLVVLGIISLFTRRPKASATASAN